MSGLKCLRENYIESLRSLCHSKLRRNKTGAPRKHTWAENDGE